MNQIGSVYGQGLYALAKEEGLADVILQQLSVLEECFTSEPAYGKLLSSHDLPKAERVALLDEGFGNTVHLYVLNFLKLLTEKGYIRHFTDCCKAYGNQYRADRGILEVRVVSAVALSDSQRQKLTDKLIAITGKQIDLACREDPAVLGGVRLQFDGKQVDGTVQGRLQEMEKQLKNTVL